MIDEAYLRATSSFQLQQQQQQQQQLSPRIKGFEFYLFIYISGEWKRGGLSNITLVGGEAAFYYHYISRERKGRSHVCHVIGIVGV